MQEVRSQVEIIVAGLNSEAVTAMGALADGACVPALQWLLSRSSRTNDKDEPIDHILINQFLAERIDYQPVASLRSSHPFSFCADPVHLVAGMSDLHLGGPLVLSDDEMSVLSDIINEHFQSSGYQFVFNADGKGVFSFNKKLQVRTSSVGMLFDQGYSSSMPSGADSSLLIQLTNEIQMLLHNHEFNQQRVDRGELAVSGLWFWGEGKCPILRVNPYAAVFGSHEIESLLGVKTGATVYPEVTLSSANSPMELPALIVLRDLSSALRDNDIHQYQISLTSYDKTVFSHLVSMLKSKTIQSLSIITDCGISFDINGSIRRPFWKKIRALDYYLKPL